MSAAIVTGVDAVSAPTQFVESKNRTLAYRTVGHDGPPLLLCNRFRGMLDTWDPAFLDALAKDFTVITFDYSGLGRSTGEPPTTFLAMAQDAKDLADALGLDKIIVGGWSMGGVAAQAFLAEYPERLTHAVLIGTNPAGRGAAPPEQIFYDTALKPFNDLADETILFFEPASEASRRAAEQTHQRLAGRTMDRDVPIPSEVFQKILQTVGPNIAADPDGVREKLKTTAVPILILSGDHDISFPVENWYALSRELPTAQHLVFPCAGHGPQHQYPSTAAGYITAFIQTTRRQS